MRITLPLLAAAALAACDRAPDMPEPRDGRSLYGESCAVCHGADGTGGGPLADDLGLEPPDLTQIASRNGGTFPTTQVLSTIDGYSRGERDKPGMPEFGSLLDGDLIPVETDDGRMTPTPRRLVALTEYLESIQAE